PEHAQHRYNRSFILLMLGSFAKGWREYEWRKKRKAWTERGFKAPEWVGQELSGKRIFLHGEQGFGDTIQFSRFARSVGRQGATVILEVSPPLAGLLQRLDCQPVVVRQGEEVPDCDFHLPLMSVPFILGWAPEQNAPETPYLSADPTRIDRWSHRLCSDEF